MKRNHFIIPLSMLISVALFSCGNSSQAEIDNSDTAIDSLVPSAKAYTVTWKNWDGTVLETDRNVAYGSTPSYDGATPTRVGDAQHSYAFAGWSPAVTAVSRDATYTAQFDIVTLVQDFTPSPAFLRINVGDSYTFGVSGKTPSNATELIMPRVQDPEIIRYDGYGKITALANGNTNIIFETANVSKEVPVQVVSFEPVDDAVLNNWSNPAYFVTETAEISEIQFSFGINTRESDATQKMNYSMKLKKTYCMYSGSYKFKINWKLYSPDNVVVDNGTFTSASFNVNETTVMSGFTYVDWGSSFKGGAYRIVLSEVAW